MVDLTFPIECSEVVGGYELVRSDGQAFSLLGEEDGAARLFHGLPRDRLWNAADLARYLGLAERTVSKMCSQTPERLPPRVLGMTAPRWHHSVAEQWVIDQSRLPKAATGRRRIARLT